jgi:hypothetical protein
MFFLDSDDILVILLEDNIGQTKGASPTLFFSSSRLVIPLCEEYLLPYIVRDTSQDGWPGVGH